MTKHLFAISAVVLLLGLTAVVRLWPHAINRTFSQHVARYKKAIIFYSVIFCLVLPLMIIFFFKWFIPYFSLNIWFAACIVCASGLQLACTFIPEVGGTKSVIHRGLAFLSADFLLPALILLAFSSAVSSVGRASAVLASAVMATVIAIMLVNKAEHKYLLVLQALYFTAFFLVILVTTYVS